jgi:hypothetical protein
MKLVTAIVLCACVRGVLAQPIPGFHPWINVDGINTTFTYVPFDNSPDGFKDPWLAAVAGLNPEGFRFMDWRQTNASPVVNWSDRPTTDTDIKGVTEETQIRLANTLKASAWVNAPHKSTLDYNAQLGTLWGATFKGPVLKWEYTNEVWNGGDQAQGTYNLQQARAEGYPGPSDTEKMAQRAAWEGYQRFATFKTHAIAAGYKGKVEWEWGGFIVNDYWTRWGMDELKRRGVNPATVGIRLAVAPYAPGSPTDVQINPAESHATTIGKFMAFARNSIVPWIAENRATANAYGLLGVDTYEAAIGSTYTLDNPTLTDYMIALNNDPLMRQTERDYIALVLNAIGPEGVYDCFGLYGIPWSQYGDWPLLNIDQLTNPGPKYQGVQDTIDRSVPEPETWGFIGVGVGCAALGRRRAA